MSGENILLLKKPEVQKKLVELRDSNEYSTWEAVKDKFNEEYNSNVSMSALKNTYNKAIATSVTISGPEKQHFNGMFEGMANRLNNMILITDSMIKEYNKMLNLIRESEEIDDIKKSALIMDLTPKLDKLNNTLMKQLNFLVSQMAQVTIQQQKLIWDDNKLKLEMDKLQPLRLQILEEENKIAIIDRTLLENR